MKSDITSIVRNVSVYGLEESIVVSGYPMRNEHPEDWWQKDDYGFDFYCLTRMEGKDKERASKLGKSPIGSGHDNFLKGIVVQFDLTASEKMWPELQRYHFIDFVSSMSTMHRLHVMDRQYSEHTAPEVIDAFEEVVECYNEVPTEDNFLRMIYSYPSGLLLTARLTTNYQQLKTIYAQRKNHRLPEWRLFCQWIEGLPMVKELGVIPSEP